MLSVERKPKISLLKSVVSMSALFAVALNGSIAKANVYPAQVVITPAAAGVCDTTNISYVLNENASGDGTNPGVTIKIYPTGNPGSPVRVVEFAAQDKGKHMYQWDGRNGSGARVADGSYSVEITARALGYSVWTKISTDNAATSFWSPLGLTVNKREGSDNYGKVYVSNASAGTPGANLRATSDGFYRLNADMTTDGPNDGYFTGGKDWVAAGASAPWKSMVGEDDHLYVADFSNDLAFEITSDTTNVPLIDATNKTTGQFVDSIWVEGTQAAGNRSIYLVDGAYYGGASGRKGLIKYTLNSNATATPGDIGTQYIAQTVWNTFYPYDAVRDAPGLGDWYAICFRSSPAQAPAIQKFIDGPPPISSNTWATPSSYTNAYCLDVDSARGRVAYGDYAAGYVYLFHTSDGTPFSGAYAPFDAGGRVRDISFDAAGNIYTGDNSFEWVRVWSPPDGPNSKATTRTFSLTQNGVGGPAITDQPDSQAFCVGGSAVLSVTATGSSLSYQWQKNGADLVDGGDVSGATGPTLTLNNVQASDNGAIITVRICDDDTVGGDDGVVMSDPAFLSIGVSVLSPPTALTVCKNTDAIFSVVASGVGSLTYQWEKDTAGNNIYIPIGGANGTSVTLTNVQAADSGTHVHVIVTDSCGPVTSAAATLTVKSGPAIAAVAFDNTYPVGYQTPSVTLICNASGTGTLHYQWQHNSVPIPGAPDLNSYLLVSNATPPLTCASAGEYTVLVTDDCGSSQSTVGAGSATITITGAAETCDNTLDDDCDGLIDCNDPDCTASLSCCNSPWADAEGSAGVGVGLGDTDVDVNDFAIFQRCYTGIAGLGGTIPGSPAYCKCFDRNGDNYIDQADLDALLLCAPRGAGLAATCP